MVPGYDREMSQTRKDLDKKENISNLFTMHRGRGGKHTPDDATAIGLELNGFLDVSVAGAAI